jgi:hypothetical protein
VDSFNIQGIPHKLRYAPIDTTDNSIGKLVLDKRMLIILDGMGAHPTMEAFLNMSMQVMLMRNGYGDLDLQEPLDCLTNGLIGMLIQDGVLEYIQSLVKELRDE